MEIHEIETVINLLSLSFPSNNIPQQLTLIKQIPCKSYQRSLVFEFISSSFFSKTNLPIIINFLNQFSQHISQQKNFELFSFYIELLDLLLRRTLNNFSEDQPENIYICNNYDLKYQSSTQQIKDLVAHITNQENFRNLHQIFQQPAHEDLVYCSLLFLQPLLSFSCLYLSHIFSVSSKNNNTIESNPGIQRSGSLKESSQEIFMLLLQSVASFIGQIEKMNERIIFQEWLGSFLADLYKLLNITIETKQSTEIINHLVCTCRKFLENKACQDLMSVNGIVRFIFGRERTWLGNVRKGLENKYQAYIITYSLALDIRCHVLKQENQTKDVPNALKTIDRCCLVFQQTYPSGERRAGSKELRSKLKGVLNCLIRAVVKKSNDENGFIMVKEIVDYCEKSQRKNKDEIEIEENKEDLEGDHPREKRDDLIKRTLEKGIFPYVLFLDCIEWSIEAVVDFLLEDVMFLELLIKVLKRVTLCSAEEIGGWITEKQKFRMLFFTESLMEKLLEVKTEFSFNIGPLINLLKQVNRVLE